MIFVSYRRADTGGHAGRLFDRLRQWFDAEQLFYDLDGIDIGDVFPARLEAGIAHARVVLILIGPGWLAEINRRVAQPGVDFVRREVELALARPNEPEPDAASVIPLVIPLLFGDAVLPSPGDFDAVLQLSLTKLCSLNAFSFGGTQADWDAHFVQLRERIAGVPGMPAPRFRAPLGSTAIFHFGEHRLSHDFRDPGNLLASLRSRLDDSPSTVPARVALCGMGGVGKTQLALKYSLDHADRYAGIWWFDAESETRLQLEAREFCLRVSAPQRRGESPALALRQWLERQSGRWLLVFDNALETGSSTALRMLLPQRGPHHLIITSRDPAWNGQAELLALQVWSRAESADFLALRRPGEPHEALAALADDLGGLPLALEQAACYLDRSQRTVAQYRQMLADHQLAEKLLQKDSITGQGTATEMRAGVRVNGGEGHSVAATLSLAFDRLSQPARLLLRLCAFAAAEPIPERLFSEAPPPAWPDEFRTLADAMRDPLDCDEIVGELIAYGLCERISMPHPTGERADAATEPALKLHRLTQQVTRAKLTNPPIDCTCFANLLFAACPPDPRLPAEWPRYAAIAGHVTQLDTFDGLGWTNPAQISWLLDRIANYLQYGPALHTEAIHWFRRNVDINRRELGDEHRNTLTSCNNLGVALQAGGQLRAALTAGKAVLEARCRILGELHVDTLASMGNLASTRRALGDFSGARELEEKVLAGRNKLLGPDHPDTLTSMNNLAATLREQGGPAQLSVARRLQIKVLHARRRIQGEHHPETLTSINNLASTLREQGNLRSARTLLQHLLDVSRKELGDEHPDTLRCMNNLAGTLKEIGEKQGDVKDSNLPAARALQETVFDVRRHRLGESHPATLRSAHNLALTLWQMNDPQSAVSLMRVAANGYAQQLGPNHPDTQDATQAMAAMQAAMQMTPPSTPLASIAQALPTKPSTPINAPPGASP